MKYHLIINPHGGLKSGEHIFKKVKPHFLEANAELNVIKTEYAGHAREIAREISIEGIAGLCSIGGDGTMHELINGLME